MAAAIGQIVPLHIERPAAGGWMIARDQGRVVLVAGAIPGEDVTARIDRVGRGVAYGHVVSVARPSSDRREPAADPLCGGCLYAHIAYARQVEIKAQVIGDAFARIGRLPLPAGVRVMPSPDAGYRMRARLHVRDGRVGFFREGTHEICDPAATRQLLPQTGAVLERVAAVLRSLGAHAVREIDVAENIDASERALHLEGAAVDPRPFAVLLGGGVTGVTCGSETVAGSPYVVDALPVEQRTVRLRRHVQAFFQSNRYLLAPLVAHVLGFVPAGAELVDLYAGVGLFSLAAAVVRGARVDAVEGDRVAARDLEANARAAADSVTPLRQAVETYVRRGAGAPDALIVDPPRTGMSREALQRALDLRAPVAVYVSCDVATLARDARRFVDAGYTLSRVDGFDLFPNTPHVETVALFTRT